MFLLRQLLRGQFIKLYHFCGQVSSLLETFCEEHDFCDHPVLRNHHGHGSKQYLEIIWKLYSAFVARIHGDEDAALLLEGSLFAIEFEHFLSHHFSLANVL